MSSWRTSYQITERDRCSAPDDRTDPCSVVPHAEVATDTTWIGAGRIVDDRGRRCDRDGVEIAEYCDEGVREAERQGLLIAGLAQNDEWQDGNRGERRLTRKPLPVVARPTRDGRAAQSAPRQRSCTGCTVFRSSFRTTEITSVGIADAVRSVGGSSWRIAWSVSTVEARGHGCAPVSIFLENDPKREEITALVDVMPLDLLGRHVGRGSQDVAPERHLGRRVAIPWERRLRDPLR